MQLRNRDIIELIYFWLSNFDRRFRPFLNKKLKNKAFSDNPGFLGYKVNISFLTDKLPYSQICGIKVGTSYKNGVITIILGLTWLEWVLFRCNMKMEWRQKRPVLAVKSNLTSNFRGSWAPVVWRQFRPIPENRFKFEFDLTLRSNLPILITAAFWIIWLEICYNFW